MLDQRGHFGDCCDSYETGDIFKGDGWPLQRRNALRRTSTLDPIPARLTEDLNGKPLLTGLNSKWILAFCQAQTLEKQMIV